MDCPKCGGAFATVAHSGIEVQRCSQCSGLWIDALDKEDLQRMEGAEQIDTGSEHLGASFNRFRDITCPACKQAMIAMVDKDQYHIAFEACPSCYGTFFDAGEFRDLKEHTVVERFRSLVQTLRDNF